MRNLKDHAKMVISRSIEKANQIEETYDDEGPDFLVDLMTDVMHWADSRDISYNNAINTAHRHFEQEQEGTK